jgi:hypothetical protein
MGTENANETRRDTNQNGNSPAENVMLTTGVLSDDTTEQMSFVFNTVNNSHESIPPSWILLDNQSTIDIFTNNNLLKNIRKVGTPMKIHS